jgi:hypothetical protein
LGKTSIQPSQLTLPSNEHRLLICRRVIPNQKSGEAQAIRQTRCPSRIMGHKRTIPYLLVQHHRLL